MKIIAHRANDKVHKENSLEAILNSLKSHYTSGIEIDVRLTKDKKLILNHDPFYNGNYIRKTNSLKLQKLGLNTLEEILENITTTKIIMIEIKVEDKDINVMTKTLIKTLNKNNLNYYICSFNYKFIKHLNTLNKYKCGLIIGKKINENHIDNPFDFNSINHSYKKNIPLKETFWWLINKEKQINSKTNIITDDPKMMYEIISKL